jgi:hypothetical protein
MSYDHGNSMLALVKKILMQLRFLFRNLTRFHQERLVQILKLEITSWLVMSGIRMYRNPLSFVLKYN